MKQQDSGNCELPVPGRTRRNSRIQMPVLDRTQENSRIQGRRLFGSRKLAAALCAAAILLMTGCGKQETIRIASKPMTESYILTEMQKQLIEHDTDYKAEITKGVGGGTTNIEPALEKGEFDLYPEYTRTAWLNVLKKMEMEKDDEKLYEELQAAYREKGLIWTGLYGFSNTYGLAMRKDRAEALNIRSYSDLAKKSGELIFGGNPDYLELATGYQRLCDAYGMQFADTKQIDIGLKYEALENGDVDVINAFTTDAKLASEDLLVLTDDQNFFERYDAGTVVRLDALERFPGLEDALKKMNGLITESEMQKLNARVEAGEEDAAVAKDFLTEKGLLQ